jgi:hypothetical protein
MDLVSMGFTAGQVAQALSLSDNNSETALELLLSGAIEEGADPPAAAAAAASSASDVVVRQCTISQYSLQGGHSACTVISTMLASEALRALQQPPRNNPLDLCDLFQDVITRGASLAASNDSFQHMSCEEAVLLLPPSCAGAVQCGAVLQGLLHERGCFADIFRRAREAAGGGAPLAIVLTKPPESLCVVLEPFRCLLFDSHSRPNQGMGNAYLVEARSEQEVLARLVALFPPFPADDLDEMQILMYNGIDATVFVLPSPPLPPPAPAPAPASAPASVAGAGAGGEGEGEWVVVPAPPPPEP